MSDLVRGIVRDAPPTPATSPPADAPPAHPARPVVVSTRKVSLASPEGPEAALRTEPPPSPRPAAEPVEPSAPLLGELQKVLVDARERLHDGAFPWGKLQALVDRASASLMAAPDLLWVAHSPAAPVGVDYVAFHAARVCALALRLGVSLGYDRARLLPLGVAAALFDVGLWQMPQLVDRAEALSGHDLATYRSHPRLSADIVERWAPPDVRVLGSILDHHEREHGQGFPRGLQGAAIDSDAKIIGLVDTYTALTVPPPSRPRLRPHEAIRDIVKNRNDQFSSTLIKALLSEVSVFPPGTLVRLSTDEVGRVVAVNRSHPLRPQVEILVDTKGQPLGVPKVVDLSEAPFVYITGPVAETGR